MFIAAIKVVNPVYFRLPSCNEASQNEAGAGSKIGCHDRCGTQVVAVSAYYGDLREWRDIRAESNEFLDVHEAILENTLGYH